MRRPPHRGAVFGCSGDGVVGCCLGGGGLDAGDAVEHVEVVGAPFGEVELPEQPQARPDASCFESPAVQ